MTCRIDISETENGFLIKFWSKYSFFSKSKLYVAKSTEDLKAVIDKIVEEKFPSKVYKEKG